MGSHIQLWPADWFQSVNGVFPILFVDGHDFLRYYEGVVTATPTTKTTKKQ